MGWSYNWRPIIGPPGHVGFVPVIQSRNMCEMMTAAMMRAPAQSRDTSAYQVNPPRARNNTAGTECDNIERGS